MSSGRVEFMHVVYIHQHFSTTQGSTGTRSYEMSLRLIEAGHRVTMICGSYASADGSPQESTGAAGGVVESDVDGIRVLRVGEPYADNMSFARRVGAFLRFARAAGRLACAVDGDLVLASSTPLTVGLAGLRAKKRRNIPFVFEVRDLWPEVPIAMGALRNPLLRWYARRLEKRIYKGADRVIALSPGMRDGVCRVGYPRGLVTVIPNACDLELFEPGGSVVDDPRFGSADECRFLFAGAHGLVGGLDAILDAVVELKRCGDSGIRVVFVGRGRERDRLMRRSRDEGLDPWISWVGPLSKIELARVMPAMNVGVMTVRNIPALFAASPNKFFDYIASGLPVLMNYPGWLADLVREHHCGLVVPQDDPAAFARAMVYLRDDPDMRRQMGRRSRALAEAEFSRDALARRFIEVLEPAQRGVAVPRPVRIGAS